MLAVDPASLILTNGLVCVAFAGVLMISRIGMGSEGRGIRTWVLADLCITAARMVAAATFADLPVARGWVFPLPTGALGMLGVAFHIHALRRVQGKHDRPLVMLAQAGAWSLAFLVPAALMDSLTHRLRWFDAFLLCSSLATLVVLRPLLHFWGARLMAMPMVLAVGFQSLRFGAVLLGMDMELADDAERSLRAQVTSGALVIDLVVGLVLTGGFVLLLQERLRARIERLVVTDALTGAMNRHGLTPQIERAIAHARRHGRPLSVALLDLDHFKRVNDTHGHAAGDQVLAGFAAKVGAQLRAGDSLGRWGGEEFLLLLPDTSLADAQSLAERLRQLVACEPLAEGVPPVTVSAGIASATEIQPGTEALLALLDLADKRLYVAKRSRNCVVIDDAMRPA